MLFWSFLFICIFFVHSALRSDSLGSQSSMQSDHRSTNHQTASGAPDAGLPGSPRTDARYHSSNDLARGQDSYTSAFKSDVFTCYSQPSSPAKSRTGQTTAYGGGGKGASGMHKAISMNDNLHRSAPLNFGNFMRDA